MYNRYHAGKNGIRVGKMYFSKYSIKDVVPPFKNLYDHKIRFLTL